jgi:hypothetical protein
MNRNKLLLTAAAVTLVVGTGGAFAQQELDHKGAAQKSAPAAQNPAGAVQQNQNRSGERSQAVQGRHETSGQAPASNKSADEQKTNQPNQAGAKANQPKQATENKEPNVRNSRTGQDTRRNENQRSTTGQAGNETNRLNRTERGQVTTPPNENRATTTERSQNRNEVQGGANVQGGQAKEGRTNVEGSRTNVNVDLSPEQRTRIHEVLIKERGAPRVANVDFSLTVGTRVPRSIHLVRVPQTIVEIEPVWRGFDYFLVGDDIVVVNPRTLEIVAVIPA